MKRVLFGYMYFIGMQHCMFPSVDLFFAVSKGDVKKVLMVLKNSRVDVNGKNSYGQTPLHLACHLGCVEIVMILLQHPNIDKNIKNNYNFTPLYIACLGGHKKVVKILLCDTQIDRELADLQGNMPIDVAYTRGDIKIIDLFLQEGFNPEILEERWCSKGSYITHAIKRLLEKYKAYNNKVYNRERHTLLGQCVIKTHNDNYREDEKKDVESFFKILFYPGIIGDRVRSLFKPEFVKKLRDLNLLSISQ